MPRVMRMQFIRTSGRVVATGYVLVHNDLHHISASAPTFRGVLTELASAVSGALGVAS